MQNSFIESQWQGLCTRLEACAEHAAEDDPEQRGKCLDQAHHFASQSAPENYPGLLAKVREAADVAIEWATDRPETGELKTGELKTGELETGEPETGESEPKGEAKIAEVSDRQADDLVEEVGMESFPASDPPSWTSAAL